MEINLLLTFIMIAAFLQPNASRFFAAMVLVGLTLLHRSFESHFGGVYFYLSSAIFDLLIIILISGIRPMPKMVKTLSLICLTSIFINAFFAWMYVEEAPYLIFYDMALFAIYVWTLAALITRDKCDVGGYRADSWAACFRLYNGARIRYRRQNKSEL